MTSSMNPSTDIHPSRLVIKGQYLLIANYKCGYSSINRLKDIETVLPESSYRDFGNKTTVFIYRDPVKRLISAFLNRFYQPPKNNIADELMRPVQSIIDPSRYKQLLILREQGELTRCFTLFVDSCLHLLKNVLGEKHFVDQTLLLRQLQLKPELLIQLSNKEQMEQLNRLLGETLPKINSSERSLAEELTNYLERDNDCLERILKYYHRDLKYFKTRQTSFSKQEIKTLLEQEGNRF